VVRRFNDVQRGKQWTCWMESNIYHQRIYQKSFAGNIFIVIFHANPWKEANAKAVSKRILKY
jgi:hypothetical protein